MKVFITLMFSFALSVAAFAEKSKQVDKLKLNGPECVSYLNKELNIKISESYQICSNKSEERKICLVENKNKSDKEKMNLCFKK